MKLDSARKQKKVVHTHPRESEEVIRSLAKLQSVQGELASTQLVLDVLSQFTILMSKNLDFENFCQAVSQILKNRLKFTYIHIWVLNGNDELTLLTPEKKGVNRTTTITKGIIGKAIRSKQTVYVEDVSQDPDYVNVHRGVASELSIPLMFEGVLLGVMNIETKNNEPLKEFIPLLEVIAENLGYALRVAFLHGVEDQFKKLLEQMREGLCVIDKTGDITYVNPALYKMCGYKEEQMVGQPYDRFFSHVDKTSFFEFKQKQDVTLTIKSKNGSEIPVLISTNHDEDNNTIATITDLRSIKHTEQKLAETEVLLASITHNAHEAIIGLDEKGLIQSWNVGAQRLFGYKEPDVVGKTLDFILHPESPKHLSIQAIIDEAQMKRFVKHIELMCSHSNGILIETAITANALYKKNGDLMGFAIFLRDISAQKKWENEIQDRFVKIQDAYREMGKQRRYIDYMSELITYADTPGITKKNIATFVANALIMIAKVNAATVRLYDSSEDKLVLLAYSGLSEDWMNKKQMPYKGSLVEVAVEQKSPLKVFDIITSSQYTSPALARKNNLRSALIIPLIYQGEILGSISLYLSHEGNLNLLDDDFISIFTSQACLALKVAAE